MRHLDLVARGCFEEEAWQRSPKVGGMGAVWIIQAFSLVFHLVVIPGSMWWGALIMFFVLAYPFIFITVAWEDELNNLFSAIIAAITSPSYIRRHMKALHSRNPSIVIRVCTFAVQEYRQQIALQHERALGIDSKWTRKRQANTGAEDGAARAIAYWSERLRQEPGISGARERVEAASAHSRKLRSALESLDRHIDALRTGFLECRQKVDAMERRIDDVAQIRQLGALPHTSGGGQALADESVKAITEELLGEAEELGAAVEDLARLGSAGTAAITGDNVEQLAEGVVEEFEEATPQSISTETPSEPEPSVVEPSKAPPKREAQPSAEPWPDPTERIAELKRQRIASQTRFQRREREIQAEYEQRKQEIQAESLQRRQEIEADSARRRQEIRARLGLDPPPTTPNDPDSASFDSLDTTPEDHPQAPPAPPSRSTSAQTPATISETEEEKQMKELVGMLRRMADLQDRRAHDLRFRDEFNWEADDREELGQKMTELADDIEMFQRLAKRMEDMESGT